MLNLGQPPIDASSPNRPSLHRTPGTQARGRRLAPNQRLSVSEIMGKSHFRG